MLVVDNSESNYIQSLVNDARVARLTTIDYEEAKPHIVPVVFVFDGNSYYIPIDKKPKRNTDPGRLRRIRNIQKNPNVALLVCVYNFFCHYLYPLVALRRWSYYHIIVEINDITYYYSLHF